MSINSDMNQAIIDLDTAVQRHAMASKREAESRKELIAAMNRVNDAQKRVDALVAELKKLTPRDSDWNRSRGNESTAER